MADRVDLFCVCCDQDLCGSEKLSAQFEEMCSRLAVSGGNCLPALAMRRPVPPRNVWAESERGFPLLLDSAEPAQQ